MVDLEGAVMGVMIRRIMFARDTVGMVKETMAELKQTILAVEVVAGLVPLAKVGRAQVKREEPEFGQMLKQESLVLVLMKTQILQYIALVAVVLMAADLVELVVVVMDGILHPTQLVVQQILAVVAAETKETMHILHPLLVVLGLLY
jgi:hypothetical protein